MKLSRFAPKTPPVLPPIEGVRIASVAAGIKYKNRNDLTLMLFEEGAAAAGVFTQSKTAGAPVEWCKAALKGGRGRAVVVNSGNSNAFTGAAGRKTARETAEAAAAAIGCKPEEVFVASTGVIGQPFDSDVITRQLPGLAKAAKADAWAGAAAAIMTTDTFPKLATRSASVGGATVTINGVAKGSGMIAPDMATMLSFLATDAAIAPELLQSLLNEAAGKSFNAITVDGDTSTSDTLLVFATGAAAKRRQKPISSPRDPGYSAFKEALEAVAFDLAMQVVKDGEGLSKFLAIHVTGAESDAAARRIGFSIANSPLFKTALAGSDPNWGRIVMAVGKSGEAADRDRLAIRFGDILVSKGGGPDAGYTEAAGAAYFKRDELEITVDIGLGSGKATVYTCDLTADYVAINADYRS